MTVLIIGGGLSGLRTLESLRRNGYAGRVVLVGSEAEVPYDRPPLSKAMFSDDAGPRSLLPSDQLDALHAELILDRRVVALDTEVKVATLQDGTAIEYDHSVIAVGVSARAVPGLGQAATLRTADDQATIRREVEASGSLLVVGAGFLGCEVAASARTQGAQVVVVEPQETPLAGVLGSEIGGEVSALHVSHGVDLRCGVGVAALAGVAGSWTAGLTDGSEVTAGACLVAAGSALDLAWLDGSGVKVENGVLCDEFGRTSAEGVWAVGDCASWWRPESSTHIRREHWTHAGDQGEAVGRSIAAGDLSGIAGPAYFWSDQYGIKIQALGDPAPDRLVDVRRVGPDQRLFAVYAAAGVVTAVVGFGLPRYVMKSRGVIGTGSVHDALALLA